MAEIKVCTKCKKSISTRDIEEGLALEREGRFFCPDCSSTVDRRRSRNQDEIISKLEAICNELKNIDRTITYEKSSVWNVLAGVAQIFALGALVPAYIRWADGDTQFLLLAIMLQIVALTFSVIGK